MTASMQSEQREPRGVTEIDARGRYRIRVSEDGEDPQWDAFLAETPGGRYVQTSLWARIKSTLKWNAVRVVDDGQCIVAGGQMASAVHWLDGICSERSRTGVG